MIIEDIEDALDRKDIARIEDAFRLLVEWPTGHALLDTDDPDELASLLDRVTAALEADRHAMPQHLVDGIIGTNHDQLWLRDDCTYASGARAVAARSLHWTTMFRDRLGQQKSAGMDLGSG